MIKTKKKILKRTKEIKKPKKKQKTRKNKKPTNNIFFRGGHKKRTQLIMNHNISELVDKYFSGDNNE